MRLILLISFLILGSTILFGQHPSLLLTKEGVATIHQNEHPPRFAEALAKAQQMVDQGILKGIDVPIPKDMAGGYTHEQHKLNYKLMAQAGALYQITEEERYAQFVNDMLLEYAVMYPSLPIHPTDRSYATGKVFWQCLNDANWLVYTSHAYDCVYDFINKKDRKKIEKDLLRPWADFLSLENPKFFNRVHNHSTWGNAAVGMAGLAMGDEELVQRALYGLQSQPKDSLAKDNDGGFIYEKGKARAGFFAQIDFAFSPDGYYTEGPYYQRYAMTPFMLFGLSLHHKRPDINIFQYRDSLLTKAVFALLYQTDQDGQFFPINDAQKGMSIQALSVVSAVNIAYAITRDPLLLSAAALQPTVLLDQQGFAVAQGLAGGQVPAFTKPSIELHDGPEGTEGALGILRALRNDVEYSAVFKYTLQGLGHGHFDKLSFSLYEGSNEILQDYGAARWVNIDQKAGGRYLKENKTWAKQTIAHNTLVVDRKSHFGGSYDVASNHHSEPQYFLQIDSTLQAACALDSNAYPGILMKRNLLIWNHPSLTKPLFIDVFTARSEETHDYELPWQYAEHMMQTNTNNEMYSTPEIMGQKHGFQHVYKEGEGEMKEETLRFTWFKDRKFYTLTSLAQKDDKAIFARIGANDPNYNLRKDAILIHRKPQQKNALFINIIEPHGDYSPVSEVPHQPYSQIENLSLEYDNQAYTIFSYSLKNGMRFRVMIAHSNHAEDAVHRLNIGDETLNWNGPVQIIEID